MLASDLSRISMLQLVLQFSPWNDRDFDDLVRLEERLEDVVHSGEVDGHDAGSNEANIYIFTEDPAAVLRACIPEITDAGLLPIFSAGYRELDEDEYSRLLPAGDPSPFDVI